MQHLYNCLESLPSPKKKEQFKAIDLASAKASACAAQKAGVKHFIYVSVAQMPTNIMKDYQQCRAEGEACIRATKIPATFIRPGMLSGRVIIGRYYFFRFLKFLNGFHLRHKKQKH